MITKTETRIEKTKERITKTINFRKSLRNKRKYT